jgi:metal-responsive CopG/Arc/MetJ family transcriptional regulator
MKEKEKRIQVTFTLEPNTVKKLDKFSEKNTINKSKFVEKLIIDHIEKNEK